MIQTSPKARFKKSMDARTHGDLMATPSMQAAFDVALQQMLWEFGTAPDGNNAAARHYMLEGAKRYVSIVLSLADPETKPKPLPGDTLPFPNA